MTEYIDDYGNRLGYCNSCGEEGELYGDCDNGCDDGEMVEYDDDTYDE